MTDLWKFSETPLLGVSSNKESPNEETIKGGMSVSDFLCKKRPDGDSQRFTLFDNLTVPFGLVYLPTCNESDDYNQEEEQEPPTSCENFDKLFSLSSITLGKKESNRRTRKKIV